ncbi:MAG: hypothetical protein FWG02_06655 [Holophagaceae bacterium]|nr:hypothetical protein [Holophagaceae bacterium]
MSNTAVDSLIQELENYLQKIEIPDSDFVAEWNKKFNEAVAVADRGQGWEEIVERAHALSKVIQTRVGTLSYEFEQLRSELNLQATGQRALKGYSSGTR